MIELDLDEVSGRQDYGWSWLDGVYMHAVVTVSCLDRLLRKFNSDFESAKEGCELHLLRSANRKAVSACQLLSFPSGGCVY